MEKERDDAHNTDTGKNPAEVDRHGEAADATPQAVTDVELSNEETTEATAATDPATVNESGSGDFSVPPPSNSDVQSDAGKGSKAPLIGAVVIVAAIAAGGYYYSQENQSASDTQTSSQTEENASSQTPDAPTSDGGEQSSVTPSADSAGNTQDTPDATTSSPDSASADSAGGATPPGPDNGSDAANAPATASAGSAEGSATGPAGDAAETKDQGDTAQGTTDSSAADSSVTNNVTDSSATESSAVDSAANEQSVSADTSANEPDAQSSSSSPSTGARDAANTTDSDSTQSGADAAAPASASANGRQSDTALPADIRDQLDRQSAQIIALRDQLESSQKQLQQLQSARLQASRNEASVFILNDVSRLVSMAQNELAISGNVENAVASLETARKAIDQADSPVLAGLQGALAADIVTLKSAPVSTQDMLFSQVSALAEKIDTLPMIAPDQPGAQPMAASSAHSAVQDSSSSGDTSVGMADSSAAWYERAWNEVKTWPAAAWDGLRSDLGGIVRVEKLADPNQVLLTVDQAAQLRANLKQNLHFARQALLNGQQGIWTSSLEAVVKGLKQSFNQDSSDTQQALAQAQALLKAGVRPQTPEITQSVKAVQETRNQLKSMNSGQE